MSYSMYCGPARDAMLGEAREQSPEAELKCRALLGLIRTCHSLQHALRREIVPNALTESGFCVLAHLVQHGAAAATPQEMADDLALTPEIVATTLGRLEISGLITRERSIQDQRVFAIKVSAAGRRAFAGALSQYLKSIMEVMSVLDPHDVATLDLVCALLCEASAHAPSS
jgi:DNA-binding MarR family transcriptional regulator